MWTKRQKAARPASRPRQSLVFVLLAMHRRKIAGSSTDGPRRRDGGSTTSRQCSTGPRRIGWPMASRIEDYALIGDCETAALVGRDGSIDWLCWPRFDSDACFAALLGGPDHGRWLIAPANATRRVDRRYRGDTVILETRFETADGAVLLVDFMPPRTGHSNLV